MMADETKRLLGEFARERSERAFRDLVRLHSPVVYSTALRMLGGDRAAAQDVMQEVFTLLARKADSLGDVILPAWLYRQTCRRAANHARTESRRRQRELVAASMMEPSPNEPSGSLEALSGEVDAAMNSLPAPSRDALVLRFFEGHDFRKLGSALGTTEEAARKRVTRALDQLVASLRKRGIAVGSASLGTTMSGFGATPVPSSLVTQVATQALKSAPLAGTTWKAEWLAPIVSGVLATSLVAGTTLALRNSTPLSASTVLATKTAPRPASQSNASEDLIAEIKRIQAGPRHSLTTLKLRATLERITIAQLPDFFLLAHDKLTTAEQAACYDLLLERWVQADPDETLTFMVDHPIWEETNKARSTSLINNTFDQWMYADLPAASAWLLAHWEAKALREESFESLLGDHLAMKIADTLLSRESASASFAFIRSLPDESLKQRTLIALTGFNASLNAWHNIGATRLKDVLHEAHQLEDRVFGTTLAAALWQKVLEDDPKKAARLESLIGPTDRFARDLGELGVRQRRTHTTPMAGGGYQGKSETVEPATQNDQKLIEAGMATGLSRDEVLHTVATSLALQRDRKRALAWIDTYRNEISFDDLIMEKFQKLEAPATGWVAGDSPYSQMIEWASRLSDEETSRRICRGAFRRLQCLLPHEMSDLETSGFLERKDIPSPIREELQQLSKTTP